MIKKYIAKRQKTTPTGTDLGKKTPKSPDWVKILCHEDYQPIIFMTLPSEAFLHLRRCHTTWRDLSWPSMFERFVNPPLSNTSTDITQLKDEFRLLQFLNRIHRHNPPLLKNDFDKLKNDTGYTACAQAYTTLKQDPDNLSPEQEEKLATLYSSLKTPYQTQQRLKMKAVSLMQESTINPDDLHKDIQSYINTNLQTETETLIERLDEKPGSNEEAKAAHTQDITTRLTDHPLLVFATDEDGATPLHWAAQEGHTDIGRILLNAGADVDAKKEDGYTPLHIAAQLGKLNIVEALLKAGADPTVTDSNGKTPRDVAEDEGQMDMALLLAKAAQTPSQSQQAQIQSLQALLHEAGETE